jgi:hypothetical protein
MARPAHFVPIRMTHRNIRDGRRTMREMLEVRRLGRGEVLRAVGFAAEAAFTRAVNQGPGTQSAVESADYRWDVTLCDAGEDINGTLRRLRLELKGRVVTRGWTHPERFNHVVVPTHSGREPIKGQADLVVLWWYSLDDPRTLWVLGLVHGRDEFKRRATFYREGTPLPAGGVAPEGGAYVIEVQQLRPLPWGLLKEK